MVAGQGDLTLSDAEMADAVYKQAMSIWIEPEVLKRHGRDGIKLPMEVHQAQIIFGLDGSHIVRLNNEVRGQLRAKINRPVKKGELITAKDVDEVVFTQLAPEDEGYGHITLISHGTADVTTWSVSFSFIYGAKRVTEFLDLGKDFLDQAELSLKRSFRVSIALGMTAAENLIKARINASPRVSVNVKTHGGLASLFAKFIKDDPLESIDQSYVETYKFFRKNFDGVRYDPLYKKVNRNTINKHLRSLRKLDTETSAMIASLPDKSLKNRRITI